MSDIKIYKTKDLVLTVDQNFDPAALNLRPWVNFIDVLCGDREYQKEAIRTAIIYLASNSFRSIEDLVKHNYQRNDEIRHRYKSLADYERKLQLPLKLSGVIDLATGTGKSYVMYGIAQICLGIGLVDKVLVLSPSLTIESGLKEKFENLSGDDRLKATIPDSAIQSNPRIVDANRTIRTGDIAVENIHAVYERTSSSIKDSLKGNGNRVLILNDEVHHAYNKSQDRDIKKWREFLLDADYNFNYILGFTGTAYIDDEYFNDVIYRYSIRQAVDDKVVKLIEYVHRDDSISKHEKLQKILDNHDELSKRYRLIKPLSIFVTKDIAGARGLHEDLIDFIEETEGIKRSLAEKKVLIVTSHKDHRKNIAKLRSVDDKTSPVEWIVSVSMLTEGWDVKNVVQIVPWEDRAFNSKLLISQVLGRGLRIPEAYRSPQPKVRVFNHDAWSRNIKGLVDEILEIEMRLSSETLGANKDRRKYHFDLYNVDYTKEEKTVEASEDTLLYDYSKNAIALVSQVEKVEMATEYQDLSGVIKPKNTVIQKRIYSIDEVVSRIIETFSTRDFEAQVRFPKGTYDKEHLPPEKEIRDIILQSMKQVGIKSGVLTEDNAIRVFKSFQTLFRKRGSTVIFERKTKKPRLISTKELEAESIAIGALRHGATAFYSNKFSEECGKDQSDILDDVIKDESFPRSASKEINYHCFKTPVSVVLTKQEPERRFVEAITGSRVCDRIDAWIKSRDQGFYSIEYSWRKGEHPTQNSFNPDFFLKFGHNIAVVEIKADDDDSDENKAKFRWAREHFTILNEELKKQGIKQKYFFHYLSPSSYPEFIDYILDGRLFKGEFRSDLEDKLTKQAT